jgi:hypothetical protein
LCSSAFIGLPCPRNPAGISSAVMSSQAEVGALVSLCFAPNYGLHPFLLQTNRCHGRGGNCDVAVGVGRTQVSTAGRFSGKISPRVMPTLTRPAEGSDGDSADDHGLGRRHAPGYTVSVSQ